MVSQSIDAVPMHLAVAPEARSGKSLLIECAGIIATGRKPPAMSYTTSEDENEKRLVGAFMSGGPVVFIDNVKKGTKISGDFLCASITGSTTSCRRLGFTGQLLVPTNTMVAASGNNIGAEGDMAARTIACTIDAGMENPGERPFEVDLHEYCRQHRAELLRACLIVLRAFACASDREETIKRLTPMGGFESWTATVRGAISWVGELDPCTSMAALREDNPESVLLGNLMLAWRDCPTLGLQDPKKGAEHGWHTCSDVVGQKEKSTGRGLKLAMERIWEPPKRTVTVDGLGRYLSGMLRKVIRIGDQDLRFERRQNALTRRAMYALVVVPSQDDFAFGGDDQDPGPPATE